MGNPMYEVTAGEVLLNGVDILEMAPDERSRAGLFLAFQYPVAIPGVTLANFSCVLLLMRAAGRKTQKIKVSRSPNSAKC